MIRDKIEKMEARRKLALASFYLRLAFEEETVRISKAQFRTEYRSHPTQALLIDVGRKFVYRLSGKPQRIRVSENGGLVLEENAGSPNQLSATEHCLSLRLTPHELKVQAAETAQATQTTKTYHSNEWVEIGNHRLLLKIFRQSQRVESEERTACLHLETI